MSIKRIILSVFLVATIIVILIPLIMSMTPNKNSNFVSSDVPENTKETDTFASSSMTFPNIIINDEHNVKLYISNREQGKISDMIVLRTSIKYQPQKNELAYYSAIENNKIVRYYVMPIDADGQLTPSEYSYIHLPTPEGSNKKSVRIYLLGEDGSAKSIPFRFGEKYIEIDAKNAGNIVVINDTNNKYNAIYSQIHGFAVKYKNGISVNVNTETYADQVANIKLLVWKSKQDEYIEKTADMQIVSENNIFEIQNIDFTDIGEEIRIGLYVKTETHEYYSEIMKLDLLEYFIYLYNTTNKKALKELAVSTIAYAETARQYIEKTPNIFEIFRIETEYKKTLSETIDASVFEGENLFSENGKNHFYGRSITFSDKITYHLYLKPAYEKIANDVYVVFIINGEKYNAEWVKDTVYGYYKATIDNIQPYDINTPIFIQMMTKETNLPYGGMITDSVGTFIVQGLVTPRTEKEKNMFAATIYFMQKTADYLKKS